MSMTRVAGLVALVVFAAGPAPAAVVINEIFYHAPDDLDDLQFIELHSPGAAAVDLGGWKLSKGVRYTFPRGTMIEPNGYVVVCKDLKLFKKHYGLDATGPFQGAMAH